METICAISTPVGVGGIAVIRVSGADAVAVADRLFRGRHSVADMKSHTLAFGRIERDGELLDEVVVSLYRAPHSYTGEDVVEISCHGSRYVQQTLLQWLVDAGARLATAGEFTRRAFLAGKLDLMQAEAVADLIASESSAQHRLAVNQMRGGVSGEIRSLREQLLHFTSLLELELDFADHEELEFADRGELQNLAERIRERLQQLLATFAHGNAIKNGIQVAIIGRTNVGKSTLLNALLGDERAIVSDIDGTTRDTIEETVNIGGVRFRFVDTAGLRRTTDTIENIGIERSLAAARKADIVIMMDEANLSKDLSQDLSPSLSQGEGDASPLGFQPSEHQIVLHVINKADLLPSTFNLQPSTNKDFQPSTSNPQGPSTFNLQPSTLYISAKNGDIEPLLKRLEQIAAEWAAPDVMIVAARHYEALKRALEAIKRVESGLQQLSGELVAQDLHDCLDALAEITGEITSSEILANVFRHFCIGK